MNKTKLLFEVATAMLAQGAAGFWFLSAAHPLPPDLTYLDGAPATDPFYASLQEGVRLNRWAAICAGLSAFSAAATTITSWLARR